MKEFIESRDSLSHDMEISVADLIFVLSAVDNVLRQKMTFHNVSLSEDNTSLMFGDDDHGMSRQPWGGESFMAWGAWAFTSGRHYWEADVMHSSSWNPGVCKNILTSDTTNSIDSEETFLFFSMNVNDHYSLFTNA